MGRLGAEQGNPKYPLLSSISPSQLGRDDLESGSPETEAEARGLVQ